MADFIETRKIELPQGGTLEVQLTQEFLDKIKKQFMLHPEQVVTDDHVRMFVYGATDIALKKIEKDKE